MFVAVAGHVAAFSLAPDAWRSRPDAVATPTSGLRTRSARVRDQLLQLAHPPDVAIAVAAAATMSSITFPYSAHGHAASSASFISVHDSGPSYEPPSDTSSFQMNPLSSHPPRTPRTSIMSSASGMYASEYDSKDEAQVATTEVGDDEEEEDTDAADAAKSRVRREDVWREVLKTAVGRDKAFVSSFFSGLRGEHSDVGRPPPPRNCSSTQ